MGRQLFAEGRVRLYACRLHRVTSDCLFTAGTRARQSTEDGEEDKDLVKQVFLKLVFTCQGQEAA